MGEATGVRGGGNREGGLYVDQHQAPADNHSLCGPSSSGPGRAAAHMLSPSRPQSARDRRRRLTGRGNRPVDPAPSPSPYPPQQACSGVTLPRCQAFFDCGNRMGYMLATAAVTGWFDLYFGIMEVNRQNTNRLLQAFLAHIRRRSLLLDAAVVMSYGSIGDSN
jgi:hypothetical protein